MVTRLVTLTESRTNTLNITSSAMRSSTVTRSGNNSSTVMGMLVLVIVYRRTTANTPTLR